MKYLRLSGLSLLAVFFVAGCHRPGPVPAPPPQAQAPIISTMPAMPALQINPVELAKPEPPVPVVPAAPPPPPKKRVRRRHIPSRKDTNKGPPSGTTAPNGTSPPPGGTAMSPIGQLSADDANVSPKQAERTKHLIEATQKRLKWLSATQRNAHADVIAEIHAFLNQAKQSMASNDLVGAQTLANKAKILLDELLK
ncbi:MAG: hypothetical protein ACYDC6_13705 [Acidobacteriaceae bacterium]